jgi:hypothetical protein
MDPRGRPQPTEAAEYYFKYIDLVPDGDICALLEAQLSEMTTLLDEVPLERIDHRYAPDKWSIREVVGHLNDTERLFAFRAFWFARGFDSPLPSFDQHIAMQQAASGDRPWRSHVDEFKSLRTSSALFFRHLPAEAWLRGGIASDNPFTVRSLAYIGVGHVTHHANILRERYL